MISIINNTGSKGTQKWVPFYYIKLHIKGVKEMRDLQKIAHECMGELEGIGIRTGIVLDFSIDWKSTKFYGVCERVGYDCYRIKVSHRMLNEEIDIRELKDTIFHELLHTCDGCMNHGYEWKKQADIVNRKLGYNIKRCASFELNQKIRELYANEYKYMFECTECGRKVGRTRACQFTKYYNLYSCGHCGKVGTFVKIKG